MSAVVATVSSAYLISGLVIAPLGGAVRSDFSLANLPSAAFFHHAILVSGETVISAAVSVTAIAAAPLIE